MNAHALIEREAALLDVDALAARERSLGVPWGPFGREQQLRRAPAHVRRGLELATQFPGLVGSRQYLQDMPYADPNLANLTAVTAASLTAMAGAQRCAIPLNEARAGKVFKVCAGGILSTASSSPGTVVLTPFWGQSTAGVTLGASTAATYTASLSSRPWYLEFRFVIRTVSDTATSSTGVGTGFWVCEGTPGTAGNSFAIALGGTAATIDTVTASNLGLCIGVTMSAATNTLTPEYYFIETVN